MNYSSQFEQDVDEGLSLKQKSLSSRYFYDAKGTELFRQIMALDEYYLPECELEILTNQANSIVEAFAHDKFNVVELGAGDGSKTVYFLQSLLLHGNQIEYYPLDISPEALEINEQHIHRSLPYLKIHKVPGDYFNTLSHIDHQLPKLVMFMGSNIGNFDEQGAVAFLKLLKQTMRSGDALLMGVDLRKNPKTILKAYNDSQGITRAFNLNLLARINTELNGNFNIEAFDHYPYYDPANGVTHSYLVSLEDQDVQVANRSYHFDKYELMHMEISSKYSIAQIEKLAADSGFAQTMHFIDTKGYFSVSMMTVA